MVGNLHTRVITAFGTFSQIYLSKKAEMDRKHIRTTLKKNQEMAIQALRQLEYRFEMEKNHPTSESLLQQYEKAISQCKHYIQTLDHDMNELLLARHDQSGISAA